MGTTLKFEPHKVYKVISPNSDGSILPGDILSVSSDGILNIWNLNNVQHNAFITTDEQDTEIMDFEAKEISEEEYNALFCLTNNLEDAATEKAKKAIM